MTKQARRGTLSTGSIIIITLMDAEIFRPKLCKKKFCKFFGRSERDGQYNLVHIFIAQAHAIEISIAPTTF